MLQRGDAVDGAKGPMRFQWMLYLLSPYAVGRRLTSQFEEQK